jgi:hypothetical protein
MLDIRTEKQWQAAVRRAARVEALTIAGPPGLSLEGIEGMTGLKWVSFGIDGPTEGLWRMRGLPALDEVGVQFANADVDAETLLSLRVPSLALWAHRARPALELSRLPLAEAEGLERLELRNLSSATIPWNGRALLERAALRELHVSGYAMDDASWRALLSARQLRCVYLADDGECPEERERQLREALPDAEEIIVRPASLGSGEEGRPWPHDGTRMVLGPEQIAEMTYVPDDAAALTALLESCVPALSARMRITHSADGIVMESPTWLDLVFVQDLLETGPPGTPRRAVAATAGVASIDNPHLAAFVARYLEDVRAGRFAEDTDAAAAAWVQGITALAADGVDDHKDTVVREQLFAVLRDPLAAAGLDAESIVTAR